MIEPGNESRQPGQEEVNNNNNNNNSNSPQPGKSPRFNSYRSRNTNIQKYPEFRNVHEANAIDIVKNKEIGAYMISKSSIDDHFVVTLLRSTQDIIQFYISKDTDNRFHYVDIENQAGTNQWAWSQRKYETIFDMLRARFGSYVHPIDSKKGGFCRTKTHRRKRIGKTKKRRLRSAFIIH